MLASRTKSFLNRFSHKTILSRFFAGKSIYSLSDEELIKVVEGNGQPKFRAQQIKNWLFNKGVTDFNAMLDVPIALRKHLSEEYVFGSLQIASELKSKDGTIKRAYRLHDGQLIESVLMPYEDGRRTVCISSQAGCAMVSVIFIYFDYVFYI